ncbi:MAG: RNA polymerase sigma factor [Pirellulales bacterium]
MMKLNKDEMGSQAVGRTGSSTDPTRQPTEALITDGQSVDGQLTDEQLFEKYRQSFTNSQPFADSQRDISESPQDFSEPQRANTVGQQNLFATLVKRYERELYNYLRRFLADAVMAEDVFQATFLQVHVKRDMFESGRKFRPWLYTVATNQAIDAQRRNRRHRRLSLDQAYHQGTDGQGREGAGSLLDVVVGRESDPALTCEQMEHSQWIREAVTSLPEPLQKAVQLVYFRGMKYADAASIMSIPVGTVKSRLHSAIRSLGRSWEQHHTDHRHTEHGHA